MITTRAFWLGALERAVKTFCQTFLAVVALSLGGMTVGADAGLTNVDWTSVLSVSALATFLSLVTSVGNARFTAGDVVTPGTPDTVIVNQPEGNPAVEIAGDPSDYPGDTKSRAAYHDGLNH